MPVFFAVGGAIGGITIGALLYDDHSDYSNYSDYDNYSDAAERKKRRIEALKGETRSAAQSVSEYKQSDINPKLSSQELKQEPAMRVSVSAMDTDVQSKIRKEMERQIAQETGDEARELEAIEALLQRIGEIQREEQP